VSLFSADAYFDINKTSISYDTLIEYSFDGLNDIERSKYKNIIENDLKITAIFGDIHNNQIETNRAFDKQNYQTFGSVVKYSVKKSGNEISFDLIAIKDSKNFSKSYKITNSDKYPFLFHNAISEMSRFFGVNVDWMNRFLLMSKFVSAKNTEILISDYTLNYKKVIIKNGYNIFPKWGDSGQNSIYFSSYNGMKYILKKFDIYANRVKDIVSSDGMLSCSDVYNDKLLITMAPNGQPDIYVYDTKKESLNRLTTNIGIDISGSFLDENRFVFVSDRLGNPNIFISNISGGLATPITFRGKSTYCSAINNNSIMYVNDGIIKVMNRDGKLIRNSNVSGVFPQLKDNVLVFIKGNRIFFRNLSNNIELNFMLNSGKITSVDW
jgi:TolB protein